MLLRYFYDEKLAQASYFVGCQEKGEAVVIDPARFVDQYIELAESEGMRISAVTETHIHADFVSGARELAHRTSAVLHLSEMGGESWKYTYADAYESRPLMDGSTFSVGNVVFQVLHTPGHTPEHICFLLTDARSADRPMGLFSGDFIFVGDVGRPDLLEKAVGITDSAEIGARQMFHSLQRIKNLPDYLQIWPGHGAGSACGRDLGAVPSSTLGYEKLFSWAFNYDDEGIFVEELLREQPEPPYYFVQMKRLNRAGPPLLNEVDPPERLPFNRIASALSGKNPIIDTRSAGDFAARHIPGTLNIPHDSAFANWSGWLIDYDSPFYMIVDPPLAGGLVRDLGAIGLDKCGGYFESAAVKAWGSTGHELHCYNSTAPLRVVEAVNQGEATVIDVRSRAEWNEGHIPGAQHIMLGYLRERMGEIPKSKPIIVQCRSGVRSAIAASILLSSGFSDVTNLLGGFQEWETAGFPVSRERVN